MYYRDFDLKLDRLNGGYFVEVIDSPLERSKAAALDLRKEKIEGWIKCVRDRRVGRGMYQEFGELLFGALFPPELRSIWERCEATTEPRSTLRLRLDIRAPELAAIPWEIVHNGHYHLAMAPQRPIVRYSFTNRSQYLPAETRALNMLVVVSSPSDRAYLDGQDQEVERIIDCLHGLRSDGVIGRLTILRHATLSALQHELRQPPDGYHVLHYIGHGEFREVNGGGSCVVKQVGNLVLENENGTAHPVDAQMLSIFLQGTPLKLLVLNACETAVPSPTDPLLGVAQAALSTGIPAVVAMQDTVFDDAALKFSQVFYQVLAEGHHLETCMTEGRKAVMAHTSLDRPDWAIPVLFSNVPGGVLWRTPAAAAEDCAPPPAEAPRPSTKAPQVVTTARTRPSPLHNLTSPDYTGFVNREQEMQRVMRLLGAQSRASLINIHGLSGVGRSALAHEVAERCLEISRQTPDDPCSFEGIIWISPQRAAFTSESGIPVKGPTPWGLDDLCRTIVGVLRKQSLLQAKPEEQVAVMPDLLREGRYLLILDDVDEVNDKRLDEFLSSLPVPTKAILISRRPLPRCISVALSNLNTEAALRLLRQEAQEAHVRAIEGASAADLQRLVRTSDGLPVALRWAVRQLQISGRSLSWVIDQLGLAGHQPLADYCLSRSVKELTEPQRHLLLAFAIYPHPIQPEAAAVAAGIETWRRTDALTRLAQLQLVQADERSERYGMMLITRQYAMSELNADLTFRHAATRRAVEYLYSWAQATNASGAWVGNQLEEDLGNLIWAVQQAFELEEWQRVLDFRYVLNDRIHMLGYWNGAITIGKLAFKAAERLGNLGESAWCAIFPLGQAYFHQENYDEARYWCCRSIDIFAGLKDEYGLAAAERFLGRVHQAKGEFDEAGRLFNSGLERVRHFKGQRHELNLHGDLLASLGGLAEARGQHEKARQWFLRALEIFRQTESKNAIAVMLQHLGNTARSAGRYEEAESFYAESLRTLDATPWETRKAQVIFSQALLAEERSELRRAQALLEKAREVFHRHSAVADLMRVDAAMTRVDAAMAYRSRGAELSGEV